jgi:hypothetical protein
MERREEPAAPPQKLIVLLAFDKGEDGELLPAFEPREIRDEASAVRTARTWQGATSGSSPGRGPPT